MERIRILILGQTKENTYEVRNLLDSKRIELEIALSTETCKTILSVRKMNLLVLHTEVIDDGIGEFFQFLDEQGISMPMLLLGEEASRLAETLPPQEDLKVFDKPYPVEEMVRYVENLHARVARTG